MKILRSILLALLVVGVIIGVAGAYTVTRWTRGVLPTTSGELALVGLNDTVTIVRDDYGIPHIYASNTYDLRFAQGYVQAQDRWWQMEFWRHTGHGRIQELTGQSAALMGTDMFIRTIGWTEAAQRDAEAMPEDVRAELQAFADGVNAYIDGQNPGDLAFEYNILGLTGVNFEVEPWTIVDTVVWTKAMAWDLSGSNRTRETHRAALIDGLSEEMADIVQPDFDYETFPTILRMDDMFDADGQPRTPSNPAEDSAGITDVELTLAGNFGLDQGVLFGSGDNLGSNNWVVSGELTESGMPLLANDPHLGIQKPSIWYEIGLYCQPVSEDCPHHVRGFTFAASPGVVIGHNERIGWGVTNVGWDVGDLYVLEINPDNPLQYRWNDGWRDMTVREETIEFGDGGNMTIEVRETHLGPIINDHPYDRETDEVGGWNNENPMAFRWTANEPGTIIEAIFKLNQAQDWDEFRDALRLWDVPAQNIVYADVDGNIGLQIPGRVPIRAAGHTGRLPVDGTTDAYEWLGFVPYELLPHSFNPERGWIATANQAPVPLAYYDWLRDQLSDEYGEDAHYQFGYVWAPGYRGARIEEMLQASDQHSMESFQQIHGDNKFLLAEALLPYLAELELEDDTLNAARDWLLEWDYQMDMDSPQAALGGAYWYALSDLLYADQNTSDSNFPSNSNVQWGTQRLLTMPDQAWWDNTATADIVETRDDILKEAFVIAHADVVERLGADRDAWSWGALHTATFVSNPLGASGIDLVENVVNTGPVQTGGGTAIVNATGWTGRGDNPYAVGSLPSLRMILDFSDLGQSMMVHTTGQSGHPSSPHYGDMIELWRNVQYHAVMGEADAQANDNTVLTLSPDRN